MQAKRMTMKPQAKKMHMVNSQFFVPAQLSFSSIFCLECLLTDHLICFSEGDRNASIWDDNETTGKADDNETTSKEGADFKDKGSRHDQEENENLDDSFGKFQT